MWHTMLCYAMTSSLQCEVCNPLSLDQKEREKRPKLPVYAPHRPSSFVVMYKRTIPVMHFGGVVEIRSFSHGIPRAETTSYLVMMTTNSMDSLHHLSQRITKQKVSLGNQDDGEQSPASN